MRLVKIDRRYFNPDNVIAVFEKAKDSDYWIDEVKTIIVTTESAFCVGDNKSDGYYGVNWSIKKVVMAFNEHHSV